MSYEGDLPSSYETLSSPRGALNIDYFKSPPGIIRLCEVVDCVILLITGAVLVSERAQHGGGWLMFVTSVSITYVLILTVFHTCGVHQSVLNILPIWAVIELVVFGGLTMCWFVAFIIMCVYGSSHAAAGASAFFSLVALVLFAADTFFAFQTYRAAHQGALPQPYPAAVRPEPAANPGLSQTGYQAYSGYTAEPTHATHPPQTVEKH